MEDGFPKQVITKEFGKGEHSAILSTFIKLPFVIKIFFVYFWVAVLL